MCMLAAFLNRMYGLFIDRGSTLHAACVAGLLLAEASAFLSLNLPLYRILHGYVDLRHPVLYSCNWTLHASAWLFAGLRYYDPHLYAAVAKALAHSRHRDALSIGQMADALAACATVGYRSPLLLRRLSAIAPAALAAAPPADVARFAATLEASRYSDPALLDAIERHSDQRLEAASSKSADQGAGNNCSSDADCTAAARATPMMVPT